MTKIAIDSVTVTEHFWRKLPGTLRRTLIETYGSKAAVIGNSVGSVYDQLRASTVRGTTKTAAALKQFTETSGFKNR